MYYPPSHGNNWNHYKPLHTQNLKKRSKNENNRTK